MPLCCMTDCFREADHDLTVNGEEKPICATCVESFLNFVSAHPEIVQSVTIEGEDKNGHTFITHYEKGG